MRLAFFGSGAFGLPTFSRLAADGHEVAIVVSQPDRPAGRGRVLTPTPVAQWAVQTLPNVPIVKPENVNDPAIVAQIHHHAATADAWIIIAFGQKLGPQLMAPTLAPTRAALSGPRGAAPLALNLHASLLPRWRGAAPINAAILAGDRETGNTVITIADRMDAGLILGESRRTITPRQTMAELHDELAADGAPLVERVLAAFAQGTLAPRAQDEALVTRAKKITRADAVVDFTQPADACRARINGLSPSPGVTVDLAGVQLKLLRAETRENTPMQGVQDCGKVIDPAAGLIACGDGTSLALLDVHPPGGRPMRWTDYARGRVLPSPLYITSGGQPAC